LALSGFNFLWDSAASVENFQIEFTRVFLSKLGEKTHFEALFVPPAFAVSKLWPKINISEYLNDMFSKL